jgi:hypothetical protein
VRKNISGQYFDDTWVYPQIVGREEFVIYGVFDPRTSKVIYIGKTVLGVECRWRLHLNDLERDKHFNVRLQRVFNKLARLNLGELYCRPLEFCQKSELCDKEVLWIREGREFGLNLCNFREGGGSTGHSLSAEARAKISRAKKGKPNVFTARGMVSFLEKQRARIPTDKQLEALVRGRTDPEVVARNRASVSKAGRSRKGWKMTEEQKLRHKESLSKPVVTASGERCARSKLNDTSVREIRKLYQEGVSVASLAKKFGVGVRGLYSLVRGDTWKHLLKNGGISN